MSSLNNLLTKWERSISPTFEMSVWLCLQVKSAAGRFQFEIIVKMWYTSSGQSADSHPGCGERGRLSQTQRLIRKGCLCWGRDDNRAVWILFLHGHAIGILKWHVLTAKDALAEETKSQFFQVATNNISSKLCWISPCDELYKLKILFVWNFPLGYHKKYQEYKIYEVHCIMSTTYTLITPN